MILRSFLIAITMMVGFTLPTVLPVQAAAQDIVCNDIQDPELKKQCQDAGESSLKNLVRDVTNVLLFIAGGVAVLMIVWGGFRLVISSGNPDRVASARSTITFALVGLIIVILAFAIVNFVTGRLF